MIVAEHHEIDGALGFVETSGEGEPVLCVHTAGQTGAQWREVLRRLPAAGYRVIVPDLPGHGRSDPAPGGPIDDLTVYRDWLATLLDRMAVGSAYLVGCSIGGRIVLDLAAERPEATRGVVAMAASRFDGALSKRSLEREVEDSSSPSRGDRTYYGTLASVGTSVDPARAAAIATRHRREDPSISSADLIGWATHELKGRLELVTAPVRLVAGGDDFWLDPAALEAMAGRLHRVVAEVLPGIGHYPMEELEDFETLLVGWLAGL